MYTHGVWLRSERKWCYHHYLLMWQANKKTNVKIWNTQCRNRQDKKRVYLDLASGYCNPAIYPDKTTVNKRQFQSKQHTLLH